MRRIQQILFCILLLSVGQYAKAQFATGQAASVVLGQRLFTQANPNTVDSAGFYFPYGVAIDPVTGKVFVCDNFNNRVLRFSSTQAAISGGVAEATFGQPDLSSNTRNNGGLSATSLNSPSGVTVDSLGNLYVADYSNHRVLRFNNASTAATGSAA